MSETYDLANLIYIGEQYETESKLSRWSLDGGLALAVLRDLQAVKSQAFMRCGHHISLLVKSVESDHTHCELCDIYSQRNDALTMERHYKSGLDVANGALKTIAHMTGDRTAADQLGECRSIARNALLKSTTEPTNV
jgi:hypothetical protein